MLANPRGRRQTRRSAKSSERVQSGLGVIDPPRELLNLLSVGGIASPTREGCRHSPLAIPWVDDGGPRVRLKPIRSTISAPVSKLEDLQPGLLLSGVIPGRSVSV